MKHSLEIVGVAYIAGTRVSIVTDIQGPHYMAYMNSNVSHVVGSIPLQSNNSHSANILSKYILAFIPKDIPNRLLALLSTK